MVVFRCIGPNNFFLERVVFPLETLSIKAPTESRVEIWGNDFYGPIIEERIRINSSNEDIRLVA